MRRLMTKLLACCLVFALALTMCAGAFSVSAASTGTLTIGSQTVDCNGKSVVVPVTLATDNVNGYAMATYTINVPAALQTITDIAVECDSETNPAVVSYLDAAGNVVSVAAGANSATAPAIDAAGNINFKVDCTDITLAAAKTITVNIKIDINALNGAALGELCDVYDITVVEVVAADNTPDYIEVTAVDGSVTVNNLVIYAKNGSFASAYSLLYYVRADYVDAFDAQIKVERAGKEVQYLVPGVNTRAELYANKYYVFELTGITAKEVNDDITATLVAGEYFGQAATNYNLVTYALNRVAKAGDSEKLAMAAFLEYVAAAQVKFDYNTENLADADLPDEYRNRTSINVEGFVAGGERDADTKNIAVYAFGVGYKDQVEMITYAQHKGADLTGVKVKFQFKNHGAVAGDTITEIALADVTESYNANIKTVRYGIAAKDLGREVIVSIVDAEGNEICNTREYSFKVYANNKASDASDGPVSAALMKFAKAFATFKGISVDY